MKKNKRYKRIATGIVTSAAVVTIGSSMVLTPSVAQAAEGRIPAQHASMHRKAPAWRAGLKTAEAKVLGLSMAEYKEARKTKSLDQLIQDAGLTVEQFKAAMKTELTAMWKEAGVSDKDIESRLAKLNKFQERRQHKWERAERR